MTRQLHLRARMTLTAAVYDCALNDTEAQPVFEVKVRDEECLQLVRDALRAYNEAIRTKGEEAL